MMKITFSAFLATVAFAQNQVGDSEFEQLYKAHIEKFGLEDDPTSKENLRLELENIEQWNQEARDNGESTIFAWHQYSHLSAPANGFAKGLKKADGPVLRSHKNGTFVPDVSADTPSAFDWRENKTQVITPVKNQEQCGSCWSFSTTGALEGQWALAGNPLTSMSEQMLVSCDDSDSGCQGGLQVNAFDWLRNNPVCKESAWPYETYGSCHEPCSGQNVAIEAGKVTGYTAVYSEQGPDFDVDKIKAALHQKGPLAIGVAANDAFQAYRGGVLHARSCGAQADHAVLLVGYGSDAGQDYWIIKNSWGETWGENGYIRVSTDSAQHHCGMESFVDVSYPTLEGSGPTPTPSGDCNVPHCATCDAADPTKCAQDGCKMGFDFNKTDGSCKKHHKPNPKPSPHQNACLSGRHPVADCLKCDETNPRKCGQCADGFQLSPNGRKCKRSQPGPDPKPDPKPSPDSKKFSAPKIVDPCPANTSLFGMSTESSFGLVCSATCSSYSDCGENATCNQGHCVQVCGNSFGGKCAEGLSCMDGFCLMSADAHGRRDNDNDNNFNDNSHGDSDQFDDSDWFPDDDEDDHANEHNDYVFPQNSDNVQGFFGGNDKWITEIENIFNMIEKILDMLKNSQSVNSDQSEQADGNHFVSSAKADKVQGWFNPLSWLSDIKMILPLLEKIYDMLKNKQI